ncbi:hypothetical protein ACFYRN_40430 [Streptomyces sp. NPDC005227]|uniref:hypothetical protein n=1 Tax=Streptomyces sp. NPDC005227 TaxID=3364707 RepID=UPI0036B9E3AB
MEKRELTDAERTSLRQALNRATAVLAQTLYGEQMERWDREHPGDPTGFEAGHPLAELITLKHAAEELETLAEAAARSAGAKGVSYADLGAAWGFSRQAARKKWPGAVSVISEAANREPIHFEAFGGEARVVFHPEFGGWWWNATAANRQHGEAPDDLTYDTSEEAAAAAGAFLSANSTPKETQA